MKIGANLLVHTPSGESGKLVTQAAAIAVRSLVESDVSQHALHIVVVDNRCTHWAFTRWRRELHGWAPLEHLTFVASEGTSFAAARNTGYRQLNYLDSGWDLFLEFDVDNVFPRVWFTPLWQAWRRESRVGLASPGTIMSTYWSPQREPSLEIDYSSMDYSWIAHLVDEESARCRTLHRRKTGEVRHPPVLKRAECLREIGLYDEAFQGGGWEDWDENVRALHTGWKVRTFLSSFVFHWTAWERVLLGGWQGEGDACLTPNREYFFKKWPGVEEYYTEYLAARDRLYCQGGA